MNNAAMNICVQVFLCGCTFSILLDLYLVVELLGYVVPLCLPFLRTAKVFSEVATSSYNPISNV